MKKALVIILFLFLLSGCKTKKDLLGVSRIDESMVCEEYCTLDLKVISSNILNTIQVDNIYSDTIYDYQVINSNQELKLNNKLDEKIYSYDLKIKIYNPTRINHVDLMIDKEKYTFDIGNFSCLSKDQVLNEQNTHLTCNIEKSDSLHKINLENMTDRPIIVTDISIINTLNNNVKVCRNLDTSMIKAIQKECMAYTYFNKENIYKMNYLVQVDYIYNGDTYTVCYSINDSNIIESVSSIGSYILVDESCFTKSS
jgi:uncharacterized protein YcfL